MVHRLGRWLVLVLISIDQLCQVLLGGPKYVFARGAEPNPDETISSVIGRSAVAGKRWALWFAEPIVNAIMFAITGRRNHCRSSIGH